MYLFLLVLTERFYQGKKSEQIYWELQGLILTHITSVYLFQYRLNKQRAITAVVLKYVDWHRNLNEI